jgi:hypothetical protein
VPAVPNPVSPRFMSRSRDILCHRVVPGKLQSLMIGTTRIEDFCAADGSPWLVFHLAAVDSDLRAR